MGLICIPIRAKTLTVLKNRISKSARKADAIEIWVDQLSSNIPAKDIIRLTSKPIIIVNKGKKEKGKWKGSEKERIERLGEFIKAGAGFVDVDQSTNKVLIKHLQKLKKLYRSKTKIIISHHNFNGTPSESILKAKIKTAITLGADVVKISTFARTYKDNLTLFNLLNTKYSRKGKRIPLAVMAMGRKGTISRIFGDRVGSYLTFAALSHQDKTAPGQLTIEEYKIFDSFLNNN